MIENSRNGRPAPPERIIILPPLYEGVTREVFTEAQSDGFIGRSLPALVKENPLLGIYLEQEALYVEKELRIKPVTAVTPAITYYDIYARSAQKAGKQMMAISGRTIEKISEQRCQAQSETIDKSIEREKRGSDEARFFWELTSDYIQRFSASQDPASIRNALWPVRSLHLMFQKQQARASTGSTGGS